MKLILLILCLVCLTACQCAESGQLGTIVSKDYRPDHTEIMYIHNGKMLIPYPVHYPDRWSIKVKFLDKDNSPFHETFALERQVWNGLEVGQKWRKP